MEGTFVQLYTKEGEWVAQFRNVRAAERYVFNLGHEMNEYELKFEVSKYSKS